MTVKIKATCAACNASVSAPETMAGKAAKCPKCSGKIRFPSSEAETPIQPTPKIKAAPPPPASENGFAAKATAAAKGVANAAKKAEAAVMEKTDDPEAMTVMPSILRAQPVAFIFSAGWGAIGILGMMISPLFIKSGNAVNVILVSLGLFVIPAAITFAKWFLAAYGTRLIVSRDRVALRRGIISKRLTEVRCADIRNITVQQTAWQRIWSVGDIEISSAAQGDVEITMKNVAKPGDIVEKIRKFQG